MDLYPSIDLRGGRVVRLARGDFSQETVYGDDAVAFAQRYEQQGAPWIHVVDLDAALTGEPRNRSIIEAIAAAVSVPVQAGGGVRTGADVSALLEAGVRRVVMGTAAVEEPGVVRALAEAHPDAVALGVDGRDGRVAAHGWTEQRDTTFAELIEVFADVPLAAVVVTEVTRDGLLSGPATETYAALLAHTDLPVIASGGVASLGDLAGLAALEVSGRRLAGAIVGRALYEGAFTVADAVEVLA